MKNCFKKRDVISIKDFNRSEILHVLHVTKQNKESNVSNLLNGKILGSCFFEPSTRTRLSFESAMCRLGGSVIGFSDSTNTSTSKGESLHDTVKTIENYADVIVIRHPYEGAAQLAADSVNIPVINAGDGANQHPTQTFLDLFTIQECQEGVEDLHIAFVGDLKYGRTVHSLAQALTHFNARLYFISPSSLEMPKSICDELRQKGIKFSFHQSVEEIISRLDILYMTRLQSERFSGSLEYSRSNHPYVIRPNLLEKAKENLKIMHPLPRKNEIDPAIDETPHSYYFQQAANGLFTRQTLLSLILGDDL